MAPPSGSSPSPSEAAAPPTADERAAARAPAAAPVAHAGTRPTTHPNTASGAKRLEGRRLVLGVTGSVAAYKAVLLARLLLKQGAALRVVMTPSATRFVGEATFAALTQAPVLVDMFAAGSAGEAHVELAAWAELVVVAPATAELLARLASGRADEALTATLLCATCPVLLAPAMHPTMWSHPATARNVRCLQGDGRARLVGPVDGEVASGDHGVGRMAEPEALLDAALQALAPGDLRERRLVVTAGPTLEDLDPVRFIGNRSSGKMGFAIAARAAARGARVTLVAGPVTLPTPAGVSRVDVRSALHMQAALDEALGPSLERADALVMSAAVGDYRPSEPSAHKLKRSDPGAEQPGAGNTAGSTAVATTEPKLELLRLVQNPDLLATLGARRQGQRPVLVGFAVETGSDRDILDYARRKLRSKRVDVVVANHAAEAMGRDDNRATLVLEHAIHAFPSMSKERLADALLDWLVARLEETDP